MDTEFGQIMRSIRKERKMTLEEMADKLGTTKQALSRYERGERTPKITLAAKFADVLGVSLEELSGYEEHEEDPADFFFRVMQEEHMDDLLDFCDLYMNMLPEQRQMAMKILSTMAGRS